ncbi:MULTISPECIES: tyrosine-type recombinase/integrase [Halomicrobium]|uniref:Integrase family protein n=2 Tax=Halomicrobium mukohataei TaxID=57705 RepID=C7P400_HALMD|nr:MULTISPECIES: site-specific integrase [Halomicrobium]ACV47822.1 integrase family protein [Halomicrobium mukohataei DSM 12286]QCD66269.1 site-specific integrase [Halomicrobium mukohataei]QFR21075.1 tyrosine-type recombinase/integrase [Halomicrobium sp. ZPS1]
MNLEEYEKQDGMKAWLSEREVNQLLDHSDETEWRVAIQLAAHCGLRTDEVVRVAPDHVADTDAGKMLRVWESAKTGHYRETPIPSDLATTIRTVGDIREEPTDEPVIQSSKRSLRRWISRARDQLAEETSEPGWKHVGMHDLRRTWATSLRSADVDAMVVCDWGGWDDLETFLDHYRGTHSPEAQLREREKVEWL